MKVLPSDPGAALLVIGSLVFVAGAALGVPRVFTTSDPQQRRDLLSRSSLRWRAAQPLYAAGPVVAAVGVGLVGTGSTGDVEVLLRVAAGAMLLGSVAWSWACAVRAVRYLDFAGGGLPAWPFRAHVVLTVAGLALFGVALLVGAGPVWLGWTVLAADLGFALAYAWSGDIPPFVFYVLLLAVGLAL